MPSFTGSRRDFKRYFGPFLRNLVNSHTKNHKRSVGKCQSQECSETRNLEAAHLRGRERDQLIDSLLDGMPDQSPIVVDLKDFTERFRAEHTPIEKTIRVLCRKCHKMYDSLEDTESISPSQIASKEATSSDFATVEISVCHPSPPHTSKDFECDTAQLKKKLMRWSSRKNLIVFKTIQVVRAKDKVMRDTLIDMVRKMEISENPKGIVDGLLTNGGKNYGKIFCEENGVISIRADLMSAFENWPIESQE